MASPVQSDVTDIGQYVPLSVYSDLDPTKREIRLIRLGDSVELRTNSLDAAPVYRCISYHWGPSTPTRNVLFQGELIKLRETVAEMLEAMRGLYGSECFFWVDLLCINQRDLNERNSQVLMMVDIYSQATEVITWLGQSTPGSRTAFRILERELKCPVSTPWRLAGDESLSYHFEGAEEDWPSMEQLENDHDLFKNFAEVVVWPALSDLLRRPYWSRMWVVQETIVAAKSVTLCGKDMISIEKLVDVGREWIRKSQTYQPDDVTLKLEAVKYTQYQDVVNVWRPIEKILQYREEFQDKSILLLELVDSFAGKDCSDIRDKVYALRALSCEASFIEVDYTKPVTAVFLDIIHSGLLLSDGGRGFQSLPHLIYCMGLDHDRLGEQLLEVPSVSIPIKGSISGSILAVKILPVAEQSRETGVYCSPRLEIITVSKEDGKQTDIHHHVFNAFQRGTYFLNHAKHGDVLCTIPTPDPVLILLRPLHQQNTETVYQAIANVHNWGQSWSSEVSEELETNTTGELTIQENGSPQPQRVLVDSRSLAGLTLWKQPTEKWYVLR